MSWLYWVPILVTAAAGLLLGVCRFSRRASVVFAASAAALSLIAAVGIALVPPGRCVFLPLTGALTLSFDADALSALFSVLTGTCWLLVLIYAAAYMEEDENAPHFYAWLMLTLAAMYGLFYADNLMTMYMFFELVTLLSMPLVLQDRTRESVSAAVKYLLYSLAGAFMALFGVFFLYTCADAPLFQAGGAALNVAGKENLLYVSSLLVLMGFGVKAGLFPLHGWLPTAHPVAPAPASALLSGLIVKAGVFASLRWVFYTVGADALRGTWVQVTYLILALVTIFMGSMMAFREDGFKRRLAYSTVSQASYILLGISLLHPLALTGALLHVVYHAIAKSTLFLSAGAVIHVTGKTKVSELSGIGPKLPVTLWCFTIASVTLIGIPPMSAFYSKWYLAEGALGSGLGAFSWIAPVVLLISALLTAGYLLPVSVRAFFPGHGAPVEKRAHEDLRLLVPMLVFAAAAAALGVWSGPISGLIRQIVTAVLP